MPMHTPFTQTSDQLPDTLPVFPLNAALILPSGYLPLNIFEPRYINMVQDALRSHQLIGMIQPADRSPSPDLQRVGCAGRIIRYEETLDGRFLILLAGLCRFEIAKELDSIRGYRIIVPNWTPYKADFDTPVLPDKQLYKSFCNAYRSHIEKKNIHFDWEAIENQGIESMINGAISYLSISPTDKQIILEATSLKARTVALLAILQKQNSTNNTRH